MGVYSRNDLYTLWMNFRGQSNELQMMQDFGLCSKDEAQKLINEFETRMEVETLDGDHRGKAHRGEVQYCVTRKKRGRPKSMIRQQFPELAALVDNPPATYTQAPDTPLISRLTAAEIVKQAMEYAKVK